jgi:hypothetical protein
MPALDYAVVLALSWGTWAKVFSPWRSGVNRCWACGMLELSTGGGCLGMHGTGRHYQGVSNSGHLVSARRPGTYLVQCSF